MDEEIYGSLHLDEMLSIGAKNFLELNQLNVYDKYIQFIISNVLKFYRNQCPDCFNEDFCPVDRNGVATCYCQKKLILFSRKLKLEMPLGPTIWKKLPNKFKIATREICFKHQVKKYLLNKLSYFEAQQYTN